MACPLMVVVWLGSLAHRDFSQLLLHVNRPSDGKVIYILQMDEVILLDPPLACDELPNIIGLVLKTQVID